jgi:hypothetical protein
MSPSPSPVLARSPDPASDQSRTEPREPGLSKPNALGLPHTEESLALRLSDAQLDEIMRLCRPLDLPCRDVPLRILAHELRGRHDVGHGSGNGTGLRGDSQGQGSEVRKRLPCPPLGDSHG